MFFGSIPSWKRVAAATCAACSRLTVFHNDPLSMMALRPMFEGRVLPITEDIMFKWRLLVEDGRKTGHTCSQPDLIIAATALYHDLTIVSRDTSDFHKPHASVFNPWVESPPGPPLLHLLRHDT